MKKIADFVAEKQCLHMGVGYDKMYTTMGEKEGMP